MILKNVNYALKKDYELEPYDLSDLELISSMVKIILNTNMCYEVPTYRVYVPVQTSIGYSLEFLDSFHKKYAENLMNCFGNGDVVEQNISSMNQSSKVVYNTVDKNKKIEFVTTGTIQDSYSLTHETIHFETIDLNNITINWECTTECYAITVEALQKEFFKNYPYKISEYRKNEIANLIGLVEKACMLDFEINLMKVFLVKKYVTDEDIHLILKDKSDDYINYACFDMNEISDRYEQTGELYLNFMYLQRYIIGYILSSHILERINNNKKYTGQLIELIDNINNMSFIDTLNELDLEVVDKDAVILSDRSIKTLKKEYKKRIAKI